ncbi:cytochrome c3 family protein [Armatimonas sp.]|uniref:cytochrome c3 family protein n=1 Tax=Armatimonas sp. TaxID=1872638 RepID=UPI003751F835
MPNIFAPSSNVIVKMAVMGLAASPLAIMITISQFTRSPYVTKVGIPYEQPVPFSHEHHVTELGLDCRYCHTSVEKSAKAGYPATHTCMSCHSQVWSNSPLLEPVRESYEKNVPLKWITLNKVPEFVYFNHSIHLKRGINCNNCHGPVQAMQMAYKGRPFQMTWCLDCHRHPEKYVNKPEFVFGLYEKIRKGKTGTKGDGHKTIAGLTEEEQSLMVGDQYVRNAKELEEGDKLVKEYNIKKEQLSDCAVCHH